MTANDTTTGAQRAELRGSGLDIGYDGRTVIDAVDIAIPPGSFTVIVGPNACGKSTLLRALARLLRPSAGTVTLDGRDIHSIPAKELARSLGLLPQSSQAPEGITVADLVARGRFAHQRLFARWSRDDERAVADAMDRTGVTALRDRPVDELSGGQRQRVWIAMVLAQQTPLILLDEPTTYLDIAHQMDVLNLLHELNAAGRTVVAVLHDLNHAARYASHIIAMKAGQVIASGAPDKVITAQNVSEVFGLQTDVIPDPVTGNPMVVPHDTRAKG